MGRHFAVLATVLALLAAACADDQEPVADGEVAPVPAADAALDEFGCAIVDSAAPELLTVGVVFEHSDAGRDHFACDQGFVRSPPTSGDHFVAWQNCGFYTVPIRDHGAVHALEHGAVWIAYQTDLTADEVGAIEAEVGGDTHLLAAPYPGLKNPIVLSAWTRQLAVDRWADPLVDEFLADFLGSASSTAPEPGAACAGGFGMAPDQPDAGLAAIVDQAR